VKNFFVCLVVFLCSVSAFATSFSTGEVAGFFGWSASTNSGGWTPRIPGLPYYNGTIHHPFQNPHYMYPTIFSGATLSVTCNPLCAVGDTFAIDLTMSNFDLTGRRPYAYPGLNVFVGTLSLATHPVAVTSSSGIAIARFSITGDLLGCTDTACASPLFSLLVNTHGYAEIAYNLSGGEMSISSVSYALPEPSSIALFGTGLLFILGKLKLRLMNGNGYGRQC